MDYRSTFCERCGLDSDRLGSAGASAFRVCPDCSSSTCANCWNQVAGRCLACSPFRLEGAAPAAAIVRAVPVEAPPTKSRAQRTSRAKTPAKPAAKGATGPLAVQIAAASSSPGPTRPTPIDSESRGMGRAARVVLVAAVALALVVGVRAVTFTGGAVAAQDPAPTATSAPEFPGQAAPDVTDPSASSTPSGGRGPGQPADHPGVAGQPGGLDRGADGGGGGGGGGASGGGGGGGGGGGTPGTTPSPTAGSTPTPDPGTPTPDPGTPTPDPGTPTPDPGTPTPDPPTPTPDPGTPTPDPPTPTPDPGTPTPDPS